MVRRFGATWWGRAWIEALEYRAHLDPNRLPRGRTYARQDRAGEVETRPGEILAAVQGTRRTPYRVRIGVRRFDEGEWDRFLTAVAARAGHAAALLDGELEPGVVDDARAAGVELLPGPGDLLPHCSCPDWADPCKHAAAVCYLVADELDADPFALLTLRGRRRPEVLEGLRRIRSRADRADAFSERAILRGHLVEPGDLSARLLSRAPAPGTNPHAPPEDEGVRASEAWFRELGDLPLPPPARARPGSPAVWPTDPPANAPFTAGALELLAADAARRAWAVYRGESSTGLADDHDTDLTRRAADALGTGAWSALVSATGEDPRRLARRAVAWQVAGRAGARAIDQSPWRPDTRVMAAAREALVEAGAPAARIRVRLNTLTAGDVQIRLGTDGQWWRFERRGGAWELAAPPASEPDDLWT